MHISLLFSLCASALAALQPSVSADDQLSIGLTQDRISAYQDLIKGVIAAVYGQDRGTEIQTRMLNCWTEYSEANNALMAQSGRTLRLLWQACDSADRVATMNRAVYDLLQSLNRLEAVCENDMEDIENDIGDGTQIVAGELQQYLSRMVQSLGFDGQAAYDSLQTSLATEVLPLASFLPSLTTLTTDAQVLRAASNSQVSEALMESGAPEVLSSSMRDYVTLANRWSDSEFMSQIDLLVESVTIAEDEYSSDTEFDVASGNIATAIVTLYVDYSRDEVRTFTQKVQDIYALVVPFIDDLCRDVPPVLDAVASLLTRYKDLIRAVEDSAFAPRQ